MRIVEGRVQRVRGEGGGVVLVHLDQGRHQVATIGMPGSEGVGFELVLARGDRGQRRQREGEHRQHQYEQDQGHAVVGGVHEGQHAQARIEPGLALQVAEQGQEGQRHGEHHGDALDDVAQLEVAQFVRQHGLDLLRLETRQQGVEEHDALGAAEAREIGVAVGAALAAVHHEQAARREADARHQALDALLEAGVFERGELVEHRRDHARVDRNHEQLEPAPHQPGIEPPQVARLVHQGEHHPQQRQADDGADDRALDEVGEPQAGRHLVEAEALFQHELAVPVQRQVEQAGDDAEGHHQRQLVPQSRPGEGQQGQRQQLQAAQQGEADQDRAAPQHAHQAEAGLGDGIVGRFLVRRQRHLWCKLGRHAGAMARDVPDMARGQPGAQHHGQHEENDEQN